MTEAQIAERVWKSVVPRQGMVPLLMPREWLAQIRAVAPDADQQTQSRVLSQLVSRAAA
jgi:hypothetical protein